MKKITIKGREFEYETFFDCSEYGDYEWTEFYDGLEEITKKKYIFFGEKKTFFIPKFIFKVYMNIEDPSYTKTDIRKVLEKRVELLERSEEIKRGEII